MTIKKSKLDKNSSIQKNKLFFSEISAIKGLAIIFVIILHIFAYQGAADILQKTYAQFHLWQAISIFMLILGFTFRIEVEKGYSIGRIISNRLHRILIPLVFAYLISILILKIFHVKLQFDWHVFIGYLPIHGMGVYFITLYLETILFFSILYIFLKRYNIYFNIIFFLLLTMLIEYLGYYIDIKDAYLYHSSVHRFIPLIVIGYYFYDEINGRTQYILYIMGFASMLLLALYIYNGSVHFTPFNQIRSGSQSYPYEYYTFLFVVMLFKLFSIVKDYKFFKYLTFIGDGSMHIFLVQIFLFYIFIKNKIDMNIIYGFLAVFLSIAIGLIWYKLESYLLNKSRIVTPKTKPNS